MDRPVKGFLPHRPAEEGVRCPHGKKAVWWTPGAAEGTVADPWPCTENGCTWQAMEEELQREHDEAMAAVAALYS